MKMILTLIFLIPTSAYADLADLTTSMHAVCPSVVGMSASNLSNSATWYVDNGAGPAVLASADNCAKNHLTDAAILGAAAPTATTVQVVSTGASALNGTYDIDSKRLSQINAVYSGILGNGVFPNGGTTYTWPDSSGGRHTFTLVQFKAFASAVLAYVAAYQQAMEGILPFPTSPVTIP